MGGRYRVVESYGENGDPYWTVQTRFRLLFWTLWLTLQQGFGGGTGETVYYPLTFGSADEARTYATKQAVQ